MGEASVSQNLSEPFLDFVARRMQAVAEPNRIRILKLLEQREATVQDLTDELATTHQNVSKHLGILYQSGIVSRRKDGTKVWYALADFTACQLVEQATASATGFVEELATIAGLGGYA
jgi:DNA-binding transcriptional ArsR family regulator